MCSAGADASADNWGAKLLEGYAKRDAWPCSCISPVSSSAHEYNCWKHADYRTMSRAVSTVHFRTSVMGNIVKCSVCNTSEVCRVRGDVKCMCQSENEIHDNVNAVQAVVDCVLRVEALMDTVKDMPVDKKYQLPVQALFAELVQLETLLRCPLSFAHTSDMAYMCSQVGGQFSSRDSLYRWWARSDAGPYTDPHTRQIVDSRATVKVAIINELSEKFMYLWSKDQPSTCLHRLVEMAVEADAVTTERLRRRAEIPVEASGAGERRRSKRQRGTRSGH